jgi:DNA-binding transcriptional ArsR family regulator
VVATRKSKESLPSREEMLARIEAQRPEAGARLRRLVEKEGLLRAGNVYGEPYSDRQIQICLDAVFRTEYLRAQILEQVREQDRSVKQIAEALGMTPGEILREVVELRRQNLVGMVRIEDRTPYYRAL